MCDKNNNVDGKYHCYCSLLQYYRNLVNTQSFSEATIFFEKDIKKLVSEIISQEYSLLCKERDFLGDSVYYLEDYGYNENDHQNTIDMSISKFKIEKNLTYIRPHLESGSVRLVRDAFENEDNVPPLES